MLQQFRDPVLRHTRWGNQVFSELAKYYYRVSPAISDEMNRDPELRRALHFGIVEPWMNYIKLMMARPDLKSIDLDGVDPELAAFLRQFQELGDRWIGGLELPLQFRGRNPFESVEELNIVLGLVLLRTDGNTYLEKLVKTGELPIEYSSEQEAGLRSALADTGRTEDEISRILYRP